MITRKEKSMKGVDSLALIEEREDFERFIEVHEKYGDAPMYTTLNEYIDNELKLQDILTTKKRSTKTWN